MPCDVECSHASLLHTMSASHPPSRLAVQNTRYSGAHTCPKCDRERQALASSLALMNNPSLSESVLGGDPLQDIIPSEPAIKALV